MTVVPITAIVITKNEELAISKCLQSLAFCDQVVVVDSGSHDRTIELAELHGATVVNFMWNHKYPKKKQWSQQHPVIRNRWVLHVDADEFVSPELAAELASLDWRSQFAAYDICLRYYFGGRALRHGRRIWKRSLVDREKCRFPEVGDLDFPGITEVEGHYQPDCDGPIGRLKSQLDHLDPDPVASWIARHNAYSDWEARVAIKPEVNTLVRASKSNVWARIFNFLPAKPFIQFVHAYMVRGGFLDGRAGFDYAVAISVYYWMISIKRRELQHVDQVR